MSKKFNIKPPVWPRELTFEEFKKLNPQINENQIINLLGFKFIKKIQYADKI